ncbi:MAG: fibronectin type III-like domain-contianing protein [Blautia wexlerae]
MQKYLQGKLGNPARKLIAFAKTAELASGETEELCIIIPKYDMASYDDSGVTGHKSCYVLEAGTYEIFVGSDVRSVQPAGSYEEKFRVLEELQEAYAPVEAFRRMKAVQQPDGTYTATEEEVPLRTVDPQVRRKENLPAELEITGDKGYKLVDVLDGKVSLDEFTAQISREDPDRHVPWGRYVQPEGPQQEQRLHLAVSQIPCRHWEFRQAAVQTDLPVFEWTRGTKAFSCLMERCLMYI